MTGGVVRPFRCREGVTREGVTREGVTLNGRMEAEGAVAVQPRGEAGDPQGEPLPRDCHCGGTALPPVGRDNIPPLGPQDTSGDSAGVRQQTARG